MWLLVALLIGSLTGIILGTRLRGNAELVIINAFAGIVGALLGLAMSYLIRPSEAESTGLVNFLALACELVGALLVVIAFSLLHRATEKHSGTHETFESDEFE